MDLNLSQPGGNGANQATPPDLIKESSTQNFQADVMDASRSAPVLVDFWAPWCGPCRQLGPALEKVVTEFAGAVKLVKINVDENQALAGQLGVQSIPAVFAFAGGQPVDGFMGALPEGELRKFVQKIVDNAGGAGRNQDDTGSQIDQALEAANAAREAGQTDQAEQIYGAILQHVPDHTGALTGLATTLTARGDLDRASATLDMVGEEGRKEQDYLAAVAALDLKKEAAELGSRADLEARLEANPDDHDARYNLALLRNAEGDRLAAAETLVDLMRRDREWNDDAARKKLLELFEAWGPKDPATAKGRRMLSTALFS